jgi:PIN domain nuclease of toxin-antitoxin system
MLVAQAMSEPMFLLTHDAQVAKYTELAILF